MGITQWVKLKGYNEIKQKGEGETMEVRKDKNQHRFVLYDGTKEIGSLYYRPEEHGDWIAEHTVVDKAYEERGLAKKLVDALILEAQEKGIHVQPACSYVEKVFAFEPDRVKKIWKTEE